jgi:hypothetical protein
MTELEVGSWELTLYLGFYLGMFDFMYEYKHEEFLFRNLDSLVHIVHLGRMSSVDVLADLVEVIGSQEHTGHRSK